MTACATTLYQPSARATLICTGAQCERIWQRAQTWLATNSRYRIQIANDAIIQTYGPFENDWEYVAYTVTKDSRADGTTTIVIHGTCYRNTFGGCFFDPTPATNKLYYELAPIK